MLNARYIFVEYRHAYVTLDLLYILNEQQLRLVYKIST